LENEALKLDYKKSGVTLPKGMTWGQGHLVLATQKSLLHKDYISQLLYNNPITRQEVSALVSVALQEKLKVKGDPLKLDFFDTDQISLTYRQYVADVIQNDIMQGLGDNEFGPNQIMKRGQMAALMVTTNLNGWFDYGNDKIVRGTLTGIDTNGLATIVKSDGTQFERVLDAKTVFFRGTDESSRADFRVGEKVIAIVGSDASIRYLEAGGSAPGTNQGSTSTETELTGKIIDRSITGSTSLKIRDIGYQDQSYPLASILVITDGVNTKQLSSLIDGQFVTVKIKNNEISSIRLLSSSLAEGEVTSVSSESFTIRIGSSNITTTFSVKANDIKIVRENSQLPFSNLKTGDQVKVTSVLGEAREISIINVSGTKEAVVRGVDFFYGFITVRDSSGNRKEYEVLSNVLVEKGNDRISLDDLKQDDEITFEIASNGKITEIYAVGSEARSISGEVTDLSAGSSPRIYVDSERYDIDRNAKITRGSSTIDLEDIMLGAKVTVKTDDDDIVVKINVTDDEDVDVEGTVEDVDESDDEITIEQSSGLKFTLRVNSSCNFRDMTSSSSDIEYLDDIRTGWDVKLYLDNSRVKEIRVTGH
ncbi:MAG: S-layer homology domain-containing protein, partial [Desulfocucumaceae bacterium]